MPPNPSEIAGLRKGLPPTLSIEEAGRLLGYSRDTAYAAARAGVLPTICIGKRKRRVPTHRLLELLEGERFPETNGMEGS